jgi:hypothetical protein
MRKIVLPVVTAAALLAAAPALAGSVDKVFFVKRGGTAAAMFEDREACAKIAENVGLQRGGEAYGDPDYGMLSAMGAALDADSMNGGVHKAVRRAALEKCMEKRGWSQQDPADGEEKAVRKASRKNPSALDAWLKANEPAVAQAAAAPAPTAGAPAVVQAAAAAPMVAQATASAVTPAPAPAAVQAAPAPIAVPPASAEVTPAAAPAPVAAEQASTPPKP